MQNAAPPLGAALACEARAKPGGRPGISRATVSISHRNSKDDKATTRRVDLDRVVKGEFAENGGHQTDGQTHETRR